MATISTGLHIVRKWVRGGERFYVYAYRGKGAPCIHVADGKRPAITPELLAKAYDERRHRGAPDAFDTVIDLYRESHEFSTLAERTQTDYRQWLDRISLRFGRVPIRFFNGDDMRQEIVRWRDELAATPRAADRAVGTLSTLLNWAMDRTPIRQNAAKGIKHLHKVNRADLIWEERHWKAVAAVPTPIMRVLTLAKMTGISQSDLFALDWEDVGKEAIDTTRRKTGVDVVVPIYPELRKALGKRGKGPVLLNPSGKRWTQSGWQTAWRRVRPDGFDRNFHDLRGTFATVLCQLDFPDSRIAMIMGWKADRVAAIREKYVNRARVVRSMARKMGKKR